MIVFAFDRDWTVDVNAHSNHEAVPLRWVRHLAHETDHPVYAIGNQDLAEEAAIPGVVDVVGRHSDDWDEWLGEKRPDDYYKNFPLRQERLTLVADLHPDADAYVVVDDLDLSDVDRWDHYHAWEFVPAVERGEIDPDLPWVREPIPDGGSPTVATIDDPDASALSEFIDDHAGISGYEPTHTGDGPTETRSCYDLKLNQWSVERPSVDAVVWCTPVDPAEFRYHLPVDAIERVAAVGGAPPDLLFTCTETPAEEDEALYRLADDHPGAVEIASLLSLLEADDERARVDALRALATVARAIPTECTAVLPTLEALLASGDLSTPTPALATIRVVGEERPADVAPLVEVLRPYLRSNEEAERVEATRCVAAVADEDPADVVDVVPLLATVVDDRHAALEHAVYALNCIGREFPEAVEPVADTLAKAVTDDALFDDVRLNATAALGRVVGEFPGAGVDVVDELVDLFAAENYKLRNNAIGLVGDVAKVHTDIVEPHTDAIAALFPSDDDHTRFNASAGLSRVAADFPETVADHTDLLTGLLTDNHPTVRKNACWALGYLSAEEAEMTLVERAIQDNNDEVRERAEWALWRIQQ